jgi:hypothetical protein
MLLAMKLGRKKERKKEEKGIRNYPAIPLARTDRAGNYRQHRQAENINNKKVTKITESNKPKNDR